MEKQKLEALLNKWRKQERSLQITTGCVRVRRDRELQLKYLRTCISDLEQIVRERDNYFCPFCGGNLSDIGEINYEQHKG